MRRSGLIVVIATLASSIGCTTPTSYSTAQALRYDKDTEYMVDEKPNGFSLTIYYSRYQFIPESDTVALACKQALTSIAYELGERKGRKIERIEEQRIRISFGRDGVSGVTSCSATVPVTWAS